MASAVAPPAFLLDARLHVGEDMRGGAGVIHSLAGYRIAVYSAPVPEGGPNEDAVAVFSLADGCLLGMVADGMGGKPQGAQASALLIESVRKSLGTDDGRRSLRDRLIDGIDEASGRIKALGVGAGSTLAAVEICDHVLRSCHVGDSMILVVGKRGRIKLETVSHSPVGYAVEAGLLDRDDALHHDDRNVVSNMVGFQDMRIEIGPGTRLAPLDTVVLASDGLFDNLYIEEIADIVRRGSLEQAMSRLAAACESRMRSPAAAAPSKPDDLAFMLLRRDLRAPAVTPGIGL
jgi:serine/threonine protein phosphatase PrpC